MDKTPTDSIEVFGNSLTLCDVRIGPTEDKLAVEVENGTYRLSVRDDVDTSWIVVCKEGADDSVLGDKLGALSVDGGAIGIYDSALLDEVFAADPEEFYYWGESKLDANDGIRVYRESIDPYAFGCASTSGDGVFEVVEITSDETRIGVRVKVPTMTSQDHAEPRRYVMFQFLLRSRSDSVEVWLDVEYDEEDSLDALLTELSDLGDGESVATFLRGIDSIEFALNENEKVSPIQGIDLETLRSDWRVSPEALCKLMLETMARYLL